MQLFLKLALIIYVIIIYVLVIARARGIYTIYCTEARGRGLSAICHIDPECTCYN